MLVNQFTSQITNLEVLVPVEEDCGDVDVVVTGAFAKETPVSKPRAVIPAQSAQPAVEQAGAYEIDFVN